MQLLDDLARDVRYSARLLARSPAFTAIAIVSLALGIGANTAILSVIDVLMIRSLPVREPDRLVLVGSTVSGGLQYSMYEKMRDAAKAIADLAIIIRTDRFNVGIDRDRGGSPAIDGGPVRLALVSGNYFPTLGADAAFGRAFTADDDRLSASRVAVISDDYWNRRFGRAPDAIGRPLMFGDASYDVIGVMRPGFVGEWIGRPADLWIPIVWQPQIMTEIPVGGLQNAGGIVMGRLKLSTAVPAARAALQIAYERDLRDQAGPNPTPPQLRDITTDRLEVEPARRGYSPQRESFGRTLAMLMAAVGLLLLVACANVANLMLARSEARRREMAVRLAVGASRGQLIRQVLTESVVLAAAGGLVGALVAQWATASLSAFARSGPTTGARTVLSMDLDVHLDLRMLAFTSALCVLTGVLFGLAPALRGSRIAVSHALLPRGAGADAQRGRLTLGKILVVAQVAVSLVLVIGAGLLVRTLNNLTGEDLGFDSDRLLLVWSLPGQTGGRGAAAADFWRSAMDRVASVPGALAVSASNQGVLTGTDLSGLGLSSGPALRIEGEPAAPTGGFPGVRSFVAPDFFRTMGIPILAGREFTEADVAAAPRGVVISRSMARHYFGDRNPIGRRIWFPEDTAAPTTIIGVAGDFLLGGPREVARRPDYTYFSYRDREAPRRLRSMTMAVRTAGDPLAMADAIRRALQGTPLQLPILKIDTAYEQLADILVQERMVTTISTLFGALALVLACFGLYGVISYTVARRTNEIGIRMALGATRGGLLRGVLIESLTLVVTGIAVGVPATVGLTRFMAARLFGVGAADPATIVAAVALVIAAAAGAATLPARRASRVDPMVALRCE